jgi:hypothetical protein
LTILLAIKPEMSPRTIHAKNDIEASSIPGPRRRTNRLSRRVAYAAV